MNNRLPEKLTLLRKHYGFSQGDIAAKLNIPVTEYMKWENGNTIPPILQLKEISDIYKVTLDSMADNTKEVILPALETDSSIDIPFLADNAEKTQILTKVDDTQPTQTLRADLGATRVVDTMPIQETKVMEIVDEGPQKEPEDDSEKKKRTTRLIIRFASIAAAVLLALILLIKMFGGSNSSSVSDSDRRLALGDKYSLYIDKSGNLVRNGAFEPPISFSGVVQVDAYNDHALGVKQDGVVVSSDNNQEVVTWSDIIMAAAGRTHSVGLKKDGTVVCTGSNAACAVNTWENIKAVYAGNAITIGLTEEGTVVTSGEGLEAIAGQSGIRSVAIGESQILLVHEDGHVTSYSLSSSAPFDTSSWSDIEEAAAGNDVAVGLRSDGTVVAATDNESVKNRIEKWTDIRYIDACGSTVVAVTKTGTMKGAGDNSYGQYTADPEEEDEEELQLKPVENITFTETTANVQIKWDKVKNADYYEVTFSPSLSTGIPRTASSSASIPAASLTDGTTYTITITAHANDADEYKPSEPVSVTYTYNAKTVQLSSPSNIKATADVSTWYIDWSAVSHADYYIINIDNVLEDRTDRAVYIMDLTGYEWMDGSEHTVTITAYSDSQTYSESEPASTVLQFNMPRFNVTVNIAGGQQTIQVIPGNYTLAEILSFIDVPEGFTVTDSLDSTYTITSNYGITINGTFEGGTGD